LHHFDEAGEHDGMKIYTAIVNSSHFKRNLRIIYMIKQVGNKVQTALLFSTDLTLDAETIVRFYKARFQILC